MAGNAKQFIRENRTTLKDKAVLIPGLKARFLAGPPATTPDECLSRNGRIFDFEDPLFNQVAPCTRDICSCCWAPVVPGYTRTIGTPEQEQAAVSRLRAQHRGEDAHKASQIHARGQNSAARRTNSRNVPPWKSARKRDIFISVVAVVVILISGYEYFFGLAAKQRYEQRYRDTIIAAQSSLPKPPAPASSAVFNNPLDGSVRQVERYLKSRLKDPDSYESIEWGAVAQHPSGFAVRVKYRAKNSLGGYVVEQKIVELDTAGNVVRAVDLSLSGTGE